VKNKVFVIAEIGINHNGDLNIAKKLIDGAVVAGCDAVKFQKRTIDKVYTKADLDRPRESPWGTTNREQKQGLEFSQKDYEEIDRYCRERNIEWFASAWDVESQKFLSQFDLNYNKVASALLTHRELLEEIASEGRHTFISTGMSSLSQIEKAVEIFKNSRCSYELMHCNSQYPMPTDKANLNTMKTLSEKFNCDVGYSGHETDVTVSIAAVALGASSLERHITLDRCMYGSDQVASIEISKLCHLVSEARKVEKALGTGEKTITEEEAQCAAKLRTVDTL
jgi:N-acetylneuraminate synthase